MWSSWPRFRFHSITGNQVKETPVNKYERILERSRAKHRDILKKMRHLSRLKKPNFDSTVHRFHDEVFDEIDCTECGLCCEIWDRF